MRYRHNGYKAQSDSLHLEDFSFKVIAIEENGIAKSCLELFYKHVALPLKFEYNFSSNGGLSYFNFSKDDGEVILQLRFKKDQILQLCQNKN